MKEKKVILILLFSTLLVGTLYLIPGEKRIQTDSGFDSSYDSGSSSSSDSGSYSGSGSSSPVFYVTDKQMTVLVIFVIIVSFSCFYIFIRMMINANVAYKEYIKMAEEDEKRSAHEEIRKAQEKENVERFLKNNKVDINELKDELFNIYKEVQTAWMDFDYDKMRTLVTDEMYNMYQSQLKTLEIQKQKNIMKNIKYVSCEIENVIEEENTLSMDVILVVNCYDYIIKTKNEKVVRGDKNKYWTYEYYITYTKNKNVTHNCPNCGTKLNKKNSNKCPNCDTVIPNNQENWVMSKKRMKAQY